MQEKVSRFIGLYLDVGKIFVVLLITRTKTTFCIIMYGTLALKMVLIKLIGKPLWFFENLQKPRNVAPT